MDLSRDIHPLSDFQENAPAFLRQLKQSGQPLVLTVDGKAEIVVQDARSYQRLLDLAAVKEGLASIDRGEGRPMAEVFDDLENSLRPKARP